MQAGHHKILILDDERGGIQHLHDALSRKHEVVWCRNIEQGMKLLDEPDSHFDIIICGTHLASESMFDFLKEVRSKAANKEIPFVCFRVSETSFAASVDDSIETVSKMLGANGYIVIPNISDPVALEQELLSKLKQFVEAS